MLCERLEFLTPKGSNSLLKDCEEVGKMLTGLIKSLRAKN